MKRQNSVLDKIISQQYAQELSRLNPAEIIVNLFKKVSDKEAEILGRRFGLLGQKRETLERIGQTYKITRERVRQIEKEGIAKLRNFLQEDNKSPLSLVESLVSRILFEYGGVMAQNHLLDYLLSTIQNDDFNRPSLLFIVSQLTSDNLQPVKSDEQLHSGWRLRDISEEVFREIVKEIIAILESNGQPLTLEDLLVKVKKRQSFQKKKKQLILPLRYQIPKEEKDIYEDKIILAGLEISKQTAKNVFDEWGLITWKTISPRRVSDKIYLVLKKAGKPLHFNIITDLINQTGFDNRRAQSATVHNELILNDQYVLVGRGTYALKEWGYKKGTVADVIKRILIEAGRPLTKQEIIDQVLKQRLVSKSTVQLILANKKYFAKTEDGKYQVI